MASELSQAIQQVCEDKKIPIESVVETIESALAAAYRKDFGNKGQNIKVDFDLDTGGFKVFDIKEVVEDELQEAYEKMKEEKMKLAELEAKGEVVPEQEVKEVKEDLPAGGEDEEEVKKFNPKTMISLSEAKEIKKKVKLGEELVQELEVPGDFGRMAAQTAKQVVIQKLREAERTTIFEEYQKKLGELVTGTVQRQEGRVILVDFGNATAVMPIEESIRSEKYIPGSRFKFYIKNIEQSAKGPKIIISRTHPEILRKLFKLEVPEIASNAVQIKSIAREAGSRSKIAVVAKEDNIDPIGSAVGQRGTRVQTVINELGGEKVDIIEWDEDPAKFIAKALSPAKIIRVEVKSQEIKKEDEAVEEEREVSELRQAKVYVAADQLSLAIGKEGQNVRLAAKLTGWRIDILEEKGEGGDEDHADETQITSDSSDKGTGELKDGETEKQAKKQEEKKEDKPKKEDKKEGKKETEKLKSKEIKESKDKVKKEKTEDKKEDKKKEK